ncbi:hypothetical protein SAMN05421770_101543 [Granulicella rosea]|uniref:Uncharacterized protein n=1 Tax=Granulicella rosea TaxID=474952 RepID=A0A239DLT3_9BACT|nr:hypothetical protein [Granulicella rosea]SNS33377.1 hypothetical protein SAMN05421770_101543 [Granulicella rosea]
MNLTFDNLDGLGAVDYTQAVDASKPLTIERVLNEPSICHGLLCLAGTALATPVRRARVTVTNSAGTALFTGYLATEPISEYAGSASAGPVYRLAFSAVSDEWLLDRQAPFGEAAGLGALAGAVVERLVQRTAVTGFTTAGLAGGTRAVGVFVPEKSTNWSAKAGAAAASAYAGYRVLNGAIGIAPVASVTHAFNDGDGSLTVAALKTSSVKELANDVSLSGEIEPWEYVTEVVTGDGTTAAFPLAEQPFRAKAGLRLLVNDSFNAGAFDTRLWAVADPGSHLGFSSAGLNLTGGNGADGQTTLTLLDALEMGGTLVLESGSTQLTARSDGVVCGLYQGATSRANCFAGYNVRQTGGNTVVVPYVNGAEVGTAYTLASGHAYTLRLRLHCNEPLRVQQTYYATIDGVVTQFGGGLNAAPMSVVFDLIDLGAASNTPATVLYDGSIASTPASCTFVPVNSVQLTGSIGYVRATQTGSVWVTSTPPGSTTATRLIGVAGEGVDCAVTYGSGALDGVDTGKVTFFSGRIPVANEIVTVTYRGRQRAVARLEDAASIAAEAAGGASGTAAWLGRVVRPPARSSADCEAAAQAVLGFAANRAAAVAGSYVAVNPPADVWPGDVLALTTSGDTANVIVRRVVVEDLHARPEALRYAMAFANDWAEGLGLALSESFAADALLPPTAAATPGLVLANLAQLSVVSVSATAIVVDAGTAPPTGGGFEVRRRDGDFGPGVDQDLVLRSPVRGFTIPRAAVGERFYVRMYDASTPPLYSRASSMIVANVPV